MSKKIPLTLPFLPTFCFSVCLSACLFSVSTLILSPSSVSFAQESNSEQKAVTDSTSLLDHPSSDFLLGAGIATDVYFETWDTEQKRFLFQRGGRRFSFQNADFLRWGHPADFSATESCLVLNDGSIFVGLPLKTQETSESVYALKTETLVWESSLLGLLSFPVTEVAGILLNTQTPKQREPLLQELRKIQESRNLWKKSSPQDVLIFRTGERLAGEFLSLDGDTLHFRTRALSPTSQETFLPMSRELEVSLSQLVAIFFTTTLPAERFPNSETTPATYFWTGLSDGSLFRMNPSGKRPALTAIPSETIQYLESPQHSQRFLDTSESAITSATAPIQELRWLDEVAPIEIRSIKRTKKSQAHENWYVQSTPTGNRLRAGKTIYRHGFSTTAGTSLLWKLDKTYQTLGLLPVLAPKTNSESIQVQLRIYAGENLVYETILEQETSRNASSPLPELLRISLEGTQELRLETEILTPKSSALLPYCDVLFLDAFLIP